MSETTSSDRIRRTINQEFSRMEEDFDETRTIRKTLVTKLSEASQKLVLVDGEGRLAADSAESLAIITATLRALSDVERANAQAVNLKLKQQEIEVASSAASQERIQVILQSTAPGRITGSFPTEALEEELDSDFTSPIKETELKTNPRDLSD